jgi:hypothetical protein
VVQVVAVLMDHPVVQQLHLLFKDTLVVRDLHPRHTTAVAAVVVPR